LDDVVADESGDRDGCEVGDAEPVGEVLYFFRDGGVDGLVVVDQVDLVDREDHVRDPEQARDGEVAPGLFQYAVPGVDQDDHDIGGGGAGDGVAGVLHMPGAVGQDE
jgi:hypothetical protein